MHRLASKVLKFNHFISYFYDRLGVSDKISISSMPLDLRTVILELLLLKSPPRRLHINKRHQVSYQPPKTLYVTLNFLSTLIMRYKSLSTIFKGISHFLMVLNPRIFKNLMNMVWINMFNRGF